MSVKKNYCNGKKYLCIQQKNNFCGYRLQKNSARHAFLGTQERGGTSAPVPPQNSECPGTCPGIVYGAGAYDLEPLYSGWVLNTFLSIMALVIPSCGFVHFSSLPPCFSDGPGLVVIVPHPLYVD